MASKTELDRFLGSQDANLGLTAPGVQQLIASIPGDDEETYKHFANILVLNPSQSSTDTQEQSDDHAARSYRAMTMLKQDLALPEAHHMLVKGPSQAGLLAKDLLSGLAGGSQLSRYSVMHMRELFDALLEAYPEKVMAAVAAGGRESVQANLTPLLQSDQTLSILTHLVCYGATGRKGIASSEKSAAHTAKYQHMHNDSKSKISLGHRRKFVKAMSDFQLMNELAQGLTSTGAGEELCESILTVLEVVGYPPDDHLPQQQQTSDNSKEEVMVGEDILLSPLGSSGWWKGLLEAVQDPKCTFEQREAIARTCHHAFALATGNSSRICKSLAPATDATEQATEKIVEEKQEEVTNRLIEWGLTDKIHKALTSQLPLLIKALKLPDNNIMDLQATEPSATRSDDSTESSPTIRHPGRYRTVPLGSWRLQLFSLLKEILTYRGQAKNSSEASEGSPAPSVQAMNAIMELPVPPEVLKTKKGKAKEEAGPADKAEGVIYNPWPALCSFVWAYPNNDFYHILFYGMLQSVVLEHHEPTLRLILQKSKFLSRAVNSMATGSLQGVLMNSLNLLQLRSKSLPASAFLHQYMNSHDGWKANADRLTEMTLKQQMPIKGDTGPEVSLNLGSPFATKLGLSDVEEWDASTVTTAAESSADESTLTATDSETKTGGKKKKKSKKKKKK